MENRYSVSVSKEGKAAVRYNAAAALLSAVALSVLLGACGNGPATGGAGNANAANAAATPTPSPLAVVRASEPDDYTARLVLRAEATGEQERPGIPELTADIARRGDNYRFSFRMPNGEQVTYLNRGQDKFVVLNNRNQYAELTREAVGYEVPRLMMPSQIVDYVGRRTNYERLGEEQVNGRTAVKYALEPGRVQTGTQAGEVTAQSFLFVDRETGLPLRADLQADSTGEVRGVSGARVVIEMRDINTNVDASLFEIPEGMQKVSPEQVRQQVNMITGAASALAGAVMRGMDAQGASPSPTAR